MNDIELADQREELVDQIQAFFEAGMYEEVIAGSLDLLKDDSEDWDGLFQMSRALLALQDYEEAEESIQQFLITYPQSPDAIAMKGYLCQNTGKYDEAISYFEQCISIDPEDGYYYYALACALFYGANREKLFRVFPRISFNKAILERIQRAIDTLFIAIRYLPDNVDTLLLLTRCFSVLGKQDETFEYVSEAIKLDPSKTDAHLILAKYYIHQGDLYSATSHNEQALMLAPNSNEASGIQKVIEDFQSDARRYQKYKVKYWDEICKLYPDHPGYWLKLVQVKQDYGKEHPIKELKRYLKLRPEDWELQITYGKELYEDSRYFTATRHFRKMNRATPGNPHISAWLNTLSKVNPIKVYFNPIPHFAMRTILKLLKGILLNTLLILILVIRLLVNLLRKKGSGK